MLTVQEIATRSDRILEEMDRAVVGKREALELVLLGFLADGHVLIEDFPGLGKTLIARSFAQVFAMDFGRVQFTPDLMPSDVTGSSVFNQRTGDFEFRPGPIFTNLLLGDEINRAPPKTQAALLEAMQERQVTIEGQTSQLERPFLVIATQNPIEYEGTYPLPEAQLDRFILRIGIGYPSRDDEWALLERRLERGADEVSLDVVTDRNGLLEMQASIEQVHVSEPIGSYIVDIVSSTRTSQRVQVGASPRGSLAILKLSRAKAALAGRDFVTPEDVKAVAVPALSHRLILRPELLGAESASRGCGARIARNGSRACRRGFAYAHDMTRSRSPKVGAYAGLAALGLLAALALRLPELVLLAAPFAVVAAVSAFQVRTPRIEVEVELDRERALEGELLDVWIRFAPADAVERLDVLLELPAGLEVEDGSNPSTLRLGEGEERLLPLRLRCTRWGAFRVGRVHLRTHDHFGMFRHEVAIDARQPLKVYPTEEVLRALLRPSETQVFAGNHVARQKAEGIEFADIRQFVAGDRVRHVNWRATARRGELWVNEHHAERNADVVIFLDVFAEARRGEQSTLDPALRAAASLAARYLRQRDRVGFVSFGGTLNWLLPATGARQLYRIVDAMLDTRIILSYAWPDLVVVPRRTLPPASARGRSHSFVGRSSRNCVAGPTGTRLRPRRDRDLAGCVRRPEARRDTGHRAPALATPPRCGPRSLRAGRGSRCSLGRRLVTHSRDGGGGNISPSGKNRARVGTGLAALALLGAVGVYSAVAGDRLVALVAALGGLGLLVTAVALLTRWATPLPWGFVGVGAAYALFLSLRPGTVDGGAPLVAAALFIAAELSYWSIERRNWPSEGQVVVRRLALLVAAGLAAVMVGGLLLLLTSERRDGIGQEAAGIAAAVLTLAVIAVLARRSSQSDPT